MNLDEYNYKKFQVEFKKSDIDDDLKIMPLNEADLKTLEDLNYELSGVENTERGFKYTAIPCSPEHPFIKFIKTTLPEDGFRIQFTLGWTEKELDEESGIYKMPEYINSRTAKRKNNKCAMISGTILNGDTKLNEVLYTEDSSFRRYLFTDTGEIKEQYVYQKNDSVTKIYELNKPLYVSFFTNGNPKEVWFTNPKASAFPETNCSFRHSDDKAIVIKYYECGDVEYLDYTGFFFSDKRVQDINNNFPFHSRFRFYEPSLYRFARREDKTEEQFSTEERFFFYKNELNKDEALSNVGAWGVDTSSSKSIEKALTENPFFEESVRAMLGISLISDSQLDKTLQLLKMKI